MTEPRSNPDWRPLALTLAGLTAAYVVMYRFLPLDTKAYFLWPFFGWAMYCGARLTPPVALALTAGVFAVTDTILFRSSNIAPNYLFYAYLVFSVLLGRGLLARSQSPWRIVSGAAVSYAFYFLLSNFVAWLETAESQYKPHDLNSLLVAYREGLAFLRGQPGQLFGDVVFGLGLFGAHACLAKLYFPAERFVPETAQ